jgi:hypothetical protein
MKLAWPRSVVALCGRRGLIRERHSRPPRVASIGPSGLAQDCAGGARNDRRSSGVLRCRWRDQTELDQTGRQIRQGVRQAQDVWRQHIANDFRVDERIKVKLTS